MHNGPKTSIRDDGHGYRCILGKMRYASRIQKELDFLLNPQAIDEPGWIPPYGEGFRPCNPGSVSEGRRPDDWAIQSFLVPFFQDSRITG
jgi:hypothetical protein